MKRIAIDLLVVLFAFVLNSTCAWSQATAQISGTVRDQSGAVLPGVEITATQTETSVTRSTISNETGSYALPNLAIGPYRLEASLPGFRAFVQTGIELQVNTNPVINPVLQVGQVSEQVEVQANAALVETRTSGIGQVVETARVLELPLNGRSVQDLVLLAPATVQNPAGANVAQGTTAIFNRDGAVNIAGGFNWGVSYTLDGAIHNNAWNGQNISVPFPDALQEFKVETSALSAQNGMHSAGSVSLVPKSGTNEIHGSKSLRTGPRYTEAEPVRRNSGRTDSEEQTLCLRRLPGHTGTVGSIGPPHVCTDGCDACRRLYDDQFAGVQRWKTNQSASTIY